MSNGRSEGAAKVWSIPQAIEQSTVERIPNRRRSGGTRIVAPASDSAIGIEIARRADRRIAPAARTVTVRNRSEIANRVVNVALASLALIVLSPVILLVAIAVKLSSRGPVVYSQTRVGLDRRTQTIDALYSKRKQDQGGALFTIYKFRTMRADAERNSGAVWATRNDPRVTRLGRILRRTRLDELPQLVNVIMGDMNIVGPRPERPSIFVRLREDLPDYRFRQRTRPGITGWAQINHTYDTSIDDVRAKIRYDLEYLERQSLAEDLKIMVKTVPVMLFSRSGW
ncbi:MAG TPA: sugar transferase [Gemmatimonadaceae bacterium]|jgi:lipopolysaccharide/colanic/teichoic acid biosynthesis glycosyltransferase